MITLSIAAILIGFSAPKITALFPSATEKTTARFRHILMKARWVSARDERPVQVTFDLEKQRLILTERGKDGGKRKTLLTLALPEPVKMVGFWNTSSERKKRLTITFYPDGRSDGFGVFLEKGTKRVTVVGYPYRPGVAFVPGWRERPWNG